MGIENLKTGAAWVDDDGVWEWQQQEVAWSVVDRGMGLKLSHAWSMGGR